MALWNDSLVTGVPAIDEQHQSLFAVIDELIEACAKGQSRAIIGRMLNNVFDTVKEHFYDEERLQTQYAYPGMIAHKKLHAQCVSSLMAIMSEAAAFGPNDALIEKVKSKLADWFTEHINTDDKRLAAFIKRRDG
jgi:hemerythrin